MHFIQKPRNWVAGMHRLTARVMPPGGSSSGIQKALKFA